MDTRMNLLSRLNYHNVMLICHQQVLTLSILSTLLLLSCPSEAQDESPYRINFSRDMNSNTVTLRCFNDGPNPNTTLMFFLNEMELESYTMLGTIPNPSERSVTFEVDRMHEGNYSCGSVNERSTSITLIAFPTSAPISPQAKHYMVVGGTVEMPCGEAPGAALQYYFVTWVNGAGQMVYVTRHGEPPQSAEPRFRLNPSTLALIVDAVQLSDAHENYHCLLRVVDPQSTGMSMEYEYRLTRSHNITLIVLESPTVIQDTLNPQIVPGGTTAVFNCIVRGSPLPEIAWLHQGKTTDGESDKYVISEGGDGDSVTKSSTLMILSPNTGTSGEVKCIASVPLGADTGRYSFEPSSSATHLTVLGTFDDIDVRITVDQDVIYFIDLAVPLSDPVQLSLNYTDVNSGAKQSKITQAMYTNASSIVHIEHDSEVDFDLFNVKVALVSKQVNGTETDAGEYDKRKPNTPLREFIKQTPFIAGAGGGAVVASVLIICVIYIVKRCTMNIRDRVQPDRATTRRTTSLMKRVNSKRSQNMFRHDDVEMGRVCTDSESKSATPTGSSLTVANFIAKKLYAGLKHDQHGEWFHEMVQNVIKKARPTSSGLSEGLPHANGEITTQC